MRISKILNDSRNDLLYLCSRFDHFTLQAFAERTELHSTTINNMTPRANGWNWTDEWYEWQVLSASELIWKVYKGHLSIHWNWYFYSEFYNENLRFEILAWPDMSWNWNFPRN